MPGINEIQAHSLPRKRGGLGAKFGLTRPAAPATCLRIGNPIMPDLLLELFS
jgi:hypothetical protein